MKFLLWQFAAYALAAFVLGLAVAYLWSRPHAARLSRKLSFQQAHVAALQAQIGELQTSAQRHQNIVAAVGPLTEQLSAARSALTLVEAELEASVLHHTMLTNRTVELSERATRHESLAGEAERAQSDALRTRVALDSAISEHVVSRAVSEQALADALARAQSAESSLTNLRKTHERLVVDSRRELTELTLRVEQGERTRNTPIAVAPTAATVWQSAMLQEASTQPDDQILIVLPNETELLSSAGPKGTGGALANTSPQGSGGGASQERDRWGTSSPLEATQTSPGLLIELRSSE